MATGSVWQVTREKQHYFDLLASTWDKGMAAEVLSGLGNIVEEVGIVPGSRVVDLGSGTGVLLPFLISQLGNEGKIIALDFSAAMLREAKARNFPALVSFVQADVHEIPLADNCIDLAICNNAFPHFVDKGRALKEIARILREDGRLVICHTMSWERINNLHRSLGGVVASDLIPEKSILQGLIAKARLEVVRFEDSEQRYLVVARKVTRSFMVEKFLRLDAIYGNSYQSQTNNRR
jgi:ubiquinone/menaquinone biosynthesis C-methylase UbiE